jgi:hypothetical protein
MQTKSKTLFLVQFFGSLDLVGNKGTWSNKLLVTEALTKPGVVGWSGTKDRKMFRWFLNRGKSPEFSFLKFTGSRLNNLAQWTPRDLSLACFTLVGALGGMLVGMANLPLLSLHCHLKE